MRFPFLPGLFALAAAAFSTPAFAQPAPAQADPLPPLPPPTAEPSPSPPPPAASPPPAPAPPPAGQPPPPVEYVYVAPPPGPASMSDAERIHAPKYALWVGGRLGILAYAGGLYTNDLNAGTTETTGNFVRTGLGLEVDVGARLGRRYIPYLGLELGLVGPGHRFEGTSTTAGTSFFGIGFRYLAGDVDAVSFASDISFGIRKFEVQAGNTSWSATGLEIFRLGLGADIRLTSHFTLSPLLTLSGGTLTDTSGSIAFGPGQGDGQTGTPDYVNHGQIPSWAQTTYYAVVLGCGAHFDLFGR